MDWIYLVLMPRIRIKIWVLSDVYFPEDSVVMRKKRDRQNPQLFFNSSLYLLVFDFSSIVSFDDEFQINELFKQFLS